MAENLSHERGGTVCRSVYRQLLSFSRRLRAAGFDGETNRVIGVTVWSRRGFKREKTRGEIKPMPPLHRRPSRSRALAVRLVEEKKKEKKKKGKRIHRRARAREEQRAAR